MHRSLCSDVKQTQGEDLCASCFDGSRLLISPVTVAVSFDQFAFLRKGCLRSIYTLVSHESDRDTAFYRGM